MSPAGRRLRAGRLPAGGTPGRLRWREARDLRAELDGQVARGVGGRVESRDLGRAGGRHGRVGDALGVGVAGGQGRSSSRGIASRTCGRRRCQTGRPVSVPLSTIHMLATCDGSSVIPVGLEPAPLIVQLPTSDPESVYLKTLSVLESLTTHRFVPSVTTSLGLVLLLLRLKLLAAFWLPERRAGGAGVAEHLVLLGIDDPDVGAVGGYAFDGGIGRQTAGGPGAEERAAGVVDINLLVGVRDPDLVSVGSTGSAARSRVAAVQAVVLIPRRRRCIRRCDRSMSR